MAKSSTLPTTLKQEFDSLKRSAEQAYFRRYPRGCCQTAHYHALHEAERRMAERHGDDWKHQRKLNLTFN